MGVPYGYRMDIMDIHECKGECFGLDVWLTKFEATRNGAASARKKSASKCAHRSKSKRHGLATLRLVMWEMLAITVPA